MILVSLKPRILNGSNLWRSLKMLCNRKCICAVKRHSGRKSFKPQVQKECAVCSRVTSKVPHQLGACLYNIGRLSKRLNVVKTVVAWIRLNNVGKETCLLVCSHPVKVARINNCTATLNRMAVHVFCSRMGNNVAAPFKWTAKNRSCKSIVHNQRHIL